MVERRIRIVAAAAVSFGRPKRRISSPAVEVSLTPKPPGAGIENPKAAEKEKIKATVRIRVAGEREIWE
jgi:hypothetical protein